MKFYPIDQVEKYLFIDLIATIFLFYLVFSNGSQLSIGSTLLIIFVFLGSFYACLWYRDWRQLVFSYMGYSAIVSLAVFSNEWLILYGFMFADLLGRSVSRLYMLIGALGFPLMYMVTSYLLDGDPFSFISTVHLPIAILQVLTPFIIHIREQAKGLKAELASANQKIQRYIQEEERHRIARDLHDTIGQTLTMIKLKSEVAIRLIDRDSDAAKNELNEVLSTSRFALKQVRELVTTMKYIALDEELDEAGRILQTAGIGLELKKLTALPRMPKVTETMLAMSLREAITNIIKHSHATTCRIELEARAGWLCLEIEDDGRGFERSGLQEGNGLESIRERMRLLHGQADITSSAGGGTLVRLKVPIQGEEGRVST